MSHDDLSPTLGGSRAQSAPEPEAPRAAEAPPAAPQTDMPPELAALFAPFGRLAELFTEAGGTVRVSARTSVPPDAMQQGIDALVTGLFGSLGARLPITLAAIEGLVDVVEQAITPALDGLQASLREIQIESDGPEVGVPADPDGIVDAVEAPIPPVDLPPEA